MDWNVYLNKRIDDESYVEIEQYMKNFDFLLGSLVNDLEKFLDKEGRYFGVTVRLVHDLREIVINLREAKEENSEDYGKQIAFLYRTLILRAHKKYLKRGLSKADSIICISRCICESLLQLDPNPEILKAYEIFDKLYTNIKNCGKEYVYTPLQESLLEFVETGKIGLYSVDSFSIVEEEKKRKIKTPLDGSGVRVNESSNEVSEISWIDE